MKITAINTAHPLLAPACLEIVSPGITIGSCVDADLPLAGTPGRAGRIQAIIRTGGDKKGYTVENISAIGGVSVNGQVIALHQTAPLQHGDQIDVGDFRLSLDESISDANKDALPLMGDNAQQHETDLPPTTTDDLFTSLLGGPGVIPVGASTPSLQINDTPDDIFTDPRPTLLNRSDPLQTQRVGDISDILGPGQQNS